MICIMHYTYHTTGASSVPRKSHMNNGITSVKGGMPFKPNTMSQGNIFSLARIEFSENTHSEHVTKKWYGSSNSRTSSSHLSTKRNREIGKNSTMQGLPDGSKLSYKSSDKTIRNTALNRCRAGGCVAPKKKGAK